MDVRIVIIVGVCALMAGCAEPPVMYTMPDGTVTDDAGMVLWVHQHIISPEREGAGQ